MDHRPTQMSRREFATLAALATAGLAGIAARADASAMQASGGEAQASAYLDSLQPISVGMLLFPKLTALDLVAPQLLMKLMMKTDCHIVAQTAAPVMADSDFQIVPTTTFADCPHDLDVLFVPGGPRGTEQAMRNDALLDFVADRGARARYVTSVCTGSMILGAAGLLKGYKAASHWMTRDMLPIFGALPVEERVVIDRNRMTGGGITAGLDFGLTLVAKLRGEEAARLEQLILEYDPQPPFHDGSMRTARADTATRARRLAQGSISSLRSAAEATRARRRV